MAVNDSWTQLPGYKKKPKKKRKPTAPVYGQGRGGAGPGYADINKPVTQRPRVRTTQGPSPLLPPPVLAEKTTEQKVRDIALGYYGPNSVLPGPGKTADLLGTALASVNDEKAWGDFFMRTLADSNVQRLSQFQSITAEDIFYGGDPKREMPMMDKVLSSPWSPTYPMAEVPYFKRKFEQDMASNLTLPENKSFRDVMAAALANQSEAEKALEEMGLIDKGTGPVDVKQIIMDGVKEFVYRQNLADSVWKNDPAGTANVWASGRADLQTTPAQSLRLLHADDESLKEYVYEMTYSTKDPHVSDYEFQEWYLKQYGGDKLPASVAKVVLQGRYGAGMPEFIGSIGYLLGVNNPEAAKIAEVTYRKTPLGRQVDAGSSAVVDSIVSSNIVRTAMEGMGLPFLYGERGAVTLAWTIADTLRRSHPEHAWQANKGLLSHAAQNWKDSQGYTGMDEFLRLGGADPLEHQWISWAGTMGFETLLGMGIDRAGGFAVRTAAKSGAAARVAEGFGAKTTNKLLAENKSPFINSEFFGHKIHPDDAVHLADDINTPAEVKTWFDKVGGIYMAGDKFDPSFPSLKITHQFKRLSDDSIPPQRRALYMPEEQAAVDLGRNAPVRAYQQAIHAGLPQSEAVAFGDAVIRAQSGIGEPWEKQLRAREVMDGLSNRIDEYQRSVPAKKLWPEYVKELTESGIENPTGEDVYWLLNRKMNGRRAETKGRAVIASPRKPVAFAPGRVDPMRERYGHIDGVSDLLDDLDTLYGETSVGLDKAVTSTLERTIREAEADLKAYRDALVANRRERKAYLAGLEEKAPPVAALDEVTPAEPQLMAAPEHLFDTSEQIGVGQQAGLDIGIDTTARKTEPFAAPPERGPAPIPGQTGMDVLETGPAEIAVIKRQQAVEYMAKTERDLKNSGFEVQEGRVIDPELGSPVMDAKRVGSTKEARSGAEAFNNLAGRKRQGEIEQMQKQYDRALERLRESETQPESGTVVQLKPHEGRLTKEDPIVTLYHEHADLTAELERDASAQFKRESTSDLRSRADVDDPGTNDAELLAHIRQVAKDHGGLARDDHWSSPAESNKEFLGLARAGHNKRKPTGVDPISLEEIADGLQRRGINVTTDDLWEVMQREVHRVKGGRAAGRLTPAEVRAKMARLEEIEAEITRLEEGVPPRTGTPETAAPSPAGAGRAAAGTESPSPSLSKVGPDLTLQAFDEADRYRLRKLTETKQKLDEARAERAGLTAKNAGRAVPATPSQSHRFYEPKHDNAVLSLMNSSPAFRKWAISSLAFRMKQATKIFRYIVLWKMSTVFRILTDEGLRLLLDDIWPSLPLPGGTDWRVTLRPPVVLGKAKRGYLRNPILTKSYLTPEVRAVLQEFPEYEAKISGMFERVARNPWTVIKPDDADLWTRSYPGHVARHNAGPKGDPPYRDWAQAWQASMHEQTHLGGKVIPETDAMIFKAAKDADAHLRGLITSDPFYLGDATHRGWLREMNIVLDDFLKNPDSPNAVDEYVNAVSNTGLRYVSHKTTRQHFLQGPQGFTNAQLRTTAADPAIRAGIGPIEGEAPHGYHNKSTLKNGAMNVADFPYKMLDFFGGQMKNESFGYYFKRQVDDLQNNENYPKMDPETAHEQASINAFEEASRRNYMATHSALEGRLGHVFLFLPAYVQQAKFWMPWIAKHPFTAYAALSNMSKMPVNYEVPTWFPILGGMSTVDLRNMTVFPSSIRELPPPVTPIASTLADVASGFGVPGGEEVRGALSYGRGFPQGLPWNTSIDAMLYAGTGLLGQAIGTPTWNPGQWLTDSRSQDSASKFKMAGTETIALQRLRSTLVNLQVQFINGQPLNITQAKKETLVKQGTKGIEKFAVPLGVTLTLPTVTVTVDGEKVKLDLQRVADGQYAYLSARPWEKSAVLDAYPEYAPVAKAWELTGPRQLKYLYENQWVIPFVETKYDKSQVAVQEMKLGGTGSGELLSPEVYATNITDRYKQVMGWKLNSDYEAFVKANVDKWGKQQLKNLTSYQRQHFEDWNLPKRLLDQTRIFGNEHRKEIVDLFGASSLVVNEKIGDTLPMWVAEVKTRTTSMGEGEYNFFAMLENSRSDRSRKLLINSPVYDEYLLKKEEKRIEARTDFIRAATTHYKSLLKPEDFEALGIKIPKGWEGERKADGSYPLYRKNGKINGVMGFLGLIDEQGKIMDRLYAQGKFATTEYRDAYRKKAGLIAQGRKDKTIRAIVDKSISSFLISGPNALNEPDWKDPYGVTKGKKTPRANEMSALWQKVKNEFLEEGMTPKKVLAVRRKYGGIIGGNFDEAVRAWSWAYVDALSQTGRRQLTTSDNPYGWAPGWTIDSKYGKTMQKWMRDSTLFLLDRKHPLSPDFIREYDLANKASGGNLLDDMINPLM